MIDSKREQLNNIMAPVVESMGFTYVGCELLMQGRYSLLRVYIDQPQGVTIDECAEVSHQLSGVLDVEDLIKSQYNLEVSSPGLDRPLFTLPQFSEAVGQQVQLRLDNPVNGQRKLTGELKAVENEQIVLWLNDEEMAIPYSSIAKANVVYQFEDKMKKTKS